MEKKYKIKAARVVGSYVTGDMGPRSDIDIFFLWDDYYQVKRGRTHFEGIEFEYFISPEWKFYDRMRTDDTSIRVYATSRILYDPQDRLKKIKQEANYKYKTYSFSLGEESKKNYAFWMDTILNDALDLHEKGDFENYAYFTKTNIGKITELVCKLNSKMPVYDRYGITELTKIDKVYGNLVSRFLLTTCKSELSKKLWIRICKHVTKKLGNIDVENYESTIKL